MMKTLSGALFLSFALYLFAACQRNSENKAGPVSDTLSGNMLALNQKIAADPANADLYWKRALLLLEEKKADLALSDINKAIELRPTYAKYYVSLSDIYLAKGMAKPCKEALEKAIALDNQEIEAYLKLAELSLYFRDYTKVDLYTDQALKFDKSNARAYFIRAFAHKEKGDTSSAIRGFQQAVDLNQEYYDAFIQLGLLFSARKNKLAVDYLNSALNLKPQSTEAMYNLAMYYQENEEFNKAMELYRNINQLEPGNKFAYFNLGYIHMFYLQIYSEGAKYFSRAIEADPTYTEAYYNRGYCAELMGDVLNARKDYQQALRLLPNYALALDGMNRLDQLERRGDK